MSWRDRIGDGTAEFRGIVLHLERGSISAGRRVQVHEYPMRDEAYAEDLGRAAREWQITGYLIGDDYDVERQRLTDALDLPGAFEMRHSYYGTHKVVVIGEPRITESTREGGIARVNMTVLRADDKPRYPRSVTDTPKVVEARAAEAEAALKEEFEEEYNVLDLAADRVAEVEKTILDALQDAEAVVSDVTGKIARVIRTPGELAGAIMDTISGIANQLQEPLRALRGYEALFNAGETESESAAAPADARQQAQAQTAAVNLIRRGAAVAAAKASAQWSYDTRQDAQDTMDKIGQGLTEPLETSETLSPDTAQRLVLLRAAVVDDLRQRGAALPELTVYETRRAMPALVIAQRLYGDATRADEIVTRNRVRHPGAVPGGAELEVLSE